MPMLNIETDRLLITVFDVDMSQSVYLNSLDEDNRRFMPDEVFETEEEARARIIDLTACYEIDNGPLVYPVLLKDRQQIGHVEVMKIDRGWEIGFHIGKSYTRRGYATEALKAFLPVIMGKLGLSEIFGISHDTNIASQRVLQKCGFLLEFAGMGLIQGKTQRLCRYKLTV
jgi:[ribosomal protein S5]-alanine N-acetyltransferase